MQTIEEFVENTVETLAFGRYELKVVKEFIERLLIERSNIGVAKKDKIVKGVDMDRLYDVVYLKLERDK